LTSGCGIEAFTTLWLITKPGGGGGGRERGREGEEGRGGKKGGEREIGSKTYPWQKLKSSHMYTHVTGTETNTKSVLIFFRVHSHTANTPQQTSIHCEEGLSEILQGSCREVAIFGENNRVL
jgi:hypothetical protein